MLKNIFLFLGLAASCAAQNVVIQSVDGTPGVPSSGYSAYGYPHFALPGTDTQAYVSVFAEVDNITAWSGTGGSKGKVTFTANNNLSVGDVVDIWKLSDNKMGANWGVYLVTDATPSTFSIANGTAGSGTETTGVVRKRDGAGFTPNGMWTITNTGTDRSETYKLYTQDGSASTQFSPNPSLTNAPPYINLVVGSVAGNCQTTGTLAAGNREVHSPVEFDLTFISAQNGSKSHTYHYAVCANGGGYPYKGVVHATPGYRTVYTSRNIPLAGQVFGNVNQSIDWTIVQAPAGGNASLLYANYPQPVFVSGTVAGKYVVQGCPAVDHTPGACDTVGIYVSASTPPAQNLDKVEQIPCEADPSVKWGTVMDIGPSKTYHDLLSIPQKFAGPALFRIFNEGPAGKPTEYHNQLQVNLPTGSFDAANPSVVLCGVPNPGTGELPIISGDGATSNSWFNQYVVGYYGQIGFANGINDGSANSGKVQPFHHILVSNLHLQNIKKNVYSYYDQNRALKPGGNYGLRAIGVQYYSVIGVFTDKVGQPFFDDCNTQQNQWPNCTLDTFYEGNHSYGYGTAGTSTEHMFYLQAFRSTSMLNLQEGADIGSGGTECYSDRGTRSFHMYNRCQPRSGYGPATGSGGHSEIQDGYNYVLPDEYFGYQGAQTCGTRYSAAPDCQGTFGGANWFAATMEEHNNSDFIIGNLYYYDSASWNKYFGVETTHNTTGVDNSMKSFTAYNNIAVDHINSFGGAYVEDTRLGTRSTLTDLYSPAIWPRSWVQNNIIAWKSNVGCSYNCVTFGTKAHLMMTFGVNLVAPGQVTVATGLTPQYGAAGGLFRNGVSQQVEFTDYANVSPIEKHLSGWLQSNFPTYSALPYDAKTFVPQGGSAAIGKAVPLTGELAYYPPRFNAVDANMSPFTLRKDLTTLGPYDPAGSATPSQTPGGSATTAPVK